MSETPQGELVIRTIAMPKDTNANGDIFGGWLVSEMDLGGAILAKSICGCRITTVAIEKMAFLKPVRVGDVVCCYGECVKIGNTSMQIKLEVWTISSAEEPRTKVTEGLFTYVAIDDQGRPVKVRPG